MLSRRPSSGSEDSSSHHVSRFDRSGERQKTLGRQETLTPQEVRERFSLDQRYKLVLPALLVKEQPTQEKWWPVLRCLAASARHHQLIERSGSRDAVAGRALLHRWWSTPASPECCSTASSTSHPVGTSLRERWN